jgi:hypothetical protein
MLCNPFFLRSLLVHVCFESGIVVGANTAQLIAEGSKKLATGIGSAPAPGSGAEGAEKAADAEVRDQSEIEGGPNDDCGDDDEDFGLELFG